MCLLPILGERQGGGLHTLVSELSIIYKARPSTTFFGDPGNNYTLEGVTA